MRATADCLDGIGGRVFLFAQSPPDAGAGTVSRGREEAGLYGGDKEFRLYQPAGDTGKDVATVAEGVFYKALSKDCAARQVRWAEEGRYEERRRWWWVRIGIKLALA